MSLRPWLWIIAGVNGAGKTTFAERAFVDIPFINADVEARALSPDRPDLAGLAAGRIVLRQLDEAFAGAQTVAWETTLSGRFHLRILRNAASRGWGVGLIYIGLASADIALERIGLRVESGGHMVAAAEVRRRYRRSLSNVRQVAAATDLAFPIDNSSPRGHTSVVRIFRGTITRTAVEIPDWVRVALPELLLVPGTRL